MVDLSGRQFGQYRIIQPLGQGGMASVFKAYQPSMERYVAIKVLPREYVDDPQFSERFRREAKMLASLQHAHILPVFDYGQDQGYSYMVMPLVSSGTLATLMAGKPLSLDEIIRIVSQLADALGYAHARGVIHRDVKPANALMDSAGNCLLCDFGLARMVAGAAILTGPGMVLGTPAYMSPEQGRGDALDARSDIYSLGIVLFEMLTGDVPFRADTNMAVLMKHASEPLPLPRLLNPRISIELEWLVQKALSKDPADRFQTAAEMSHALRQVPLAPIKLPQPPPVASSHGGAQTNVSVDARFASASPVLRPRIKLILVGLGLVAAAIVAVALATAILLPAQPERAAPLATRSSPAESKPAQVTASPPTPTIALARSPSQTGATATPAGDAATVAIPVTLERATSTLAPTTAPLVAATSPPTPQAIRATTASGSKLIAPQLQAPAQSAVIPVGETPQFQWSSSGALALNEYYRVNIEHRLGFDTQCTRSTTILARDYLVSLAPVGRPFRWSVSVVRPDQPISEGATCEGSLVVAAVSVGEFTVGGSGSSGGTGGGGVIAPTAASSPVAPSTPKPTVPPKP